MNNTTSTKQAGGMTVERITNKVTVSRETFRYVKGLSQLSHAIRQYNPDNRKVTAEIIRGHGFEAHVGGHHVGIMLRGERLAMVTSTAPDFN